MPPSSQPPPPRRPGSRPWLAALAILVMAAAASACGGSEPTAAERPAATTVTAPPAPSTAAPTTVATVAVPRLVGMRLGHARSALSDLGLTGTVRYRTTARHTAGSVISQSRKAGSGVLPNTAVVLVVAKAPPPPPPTTAPPPPPTAAPRNCDPSYPGACLDPTAVDYDCAGGSGNGPKYVTGPVRVRPPDPFELDSDGDGWGCE
jgi:PASTA domain